MCSSLSRLAGLVLALALASAVAHADDFRDFRIPDNGFLQWNVSGNALSQWRNSQHGDSRGSWGATDGGIDNRIQGLHESDARSSRFDLSMNVYGRRSHSQSLDHQQGWFEPSDPTQIFTSEGRERALHESLRLLVQPRW